MKEFNVTITETLQKSITVEATSKDEALQMVEDMWHDGDIVLDPDDFLDVSYSADEGREINRSDKMDVLLVKPGQYAEMTTIDAGLSSMQKIVDGTIQAAYYFDEPVALVCNDEGKINGMELNRAIRDENGRMIDIIAGTFFICGTGEDNFISLQPEYREKFEKMFKKPEVFLRMGKGIKAIPFEPMKDAKDKSAAKEHEKEL